MSRFSFALMILLSLLSSAYAQNHTSPGGGAPDPDIDRGETCRNFLQSAERYEQAFVENHYGKYKNEEDFFNLLSKVTLNNDLKVLEKGIFPDPTIEDCHKKVSSELKAIKHVYLEAIRPPDIECLGFTKRKEQINLIDEVIKLYEK